VDKQKTNLHFHKILKNIIIIPLFIFVFHNYAFCGFDIMLKSGWIPCMRPVSNSFYVEADAGYMFKDNYGFGLRGGVQMPAGNTVTDAGGRTTNTSLTVLMPGIFGRLFGDSWLNLTWSIYGGGSWLNVELAGGSDAGDFSLLADADIGLYIKLAELNDEFETNDRKNWPEGIAKKTVGEVRLSFQAGYRYYPGVFIYSGIGGLSADMNFSGFKLGVALTIAYY
jgi:hypothetical protein